MAHKVEAFDIWQFFCSQIYDPLIRLRIDLDGRIDEDTLKRAVTVSLQTVPLLGCCFEGRGRKPKWVEKGFTGEDMVGVYPIETDAEDQILRQFSLVIDPSAQPQLKINIVRHPGGDTLCVIITHLVSDTTGLKQYLALLSRIYTQLAHGEQPQPGHPLTRGTKPLFTGVGWRQKWRILRSPAPANNGAVAAQQGIDSHAGGTDIYMDTRALSVDVFSSFVAFLTAHEATVNDAMIALYARAFCHVTGTNTVAFPCTIDWRKFIPASLGYGITNYSGNCPCLFSVRPGDSLADTLAQASQQMQVYKTGNDVLRSVLGWNLAVRFIPYASLRKSFVTAVPQPVVSFTNLGVIDPKQVDFAGVPVRSAYLTASIKPRPYLQLTASTYKGACTLSCNIIGGPEDKAVIDALLDDIVQEVSTAIGSE